MNMMLYSFEYPSGQQLHLVQGDITQEKVDAIVNAANERLGHAGGLAAVIARKAGEHLNRESQEWVKEHGPVTHEKPAFTSAGNLPFRYVIHAVGPVWRLGEDQEDIKLTTAIHGTMWRADSLELTSIALPAISTGLFGYPKKEAAAVMFSAIGTYFQEHPGSGLAQVRLVVYDQTTIETFMDVWEGTFS
jgi:O-acetyl-ADP-ribose deacetylase (regulator of RNase III)